MGRKDRERYLKLKSENPDYRGFRGRDRVTPRVAPVTETVVCSVCSRRRNVATDTLQEDRSTYVCLQCQQEQTGEAFEEITAEEPD